MPWLVGIDEAGYGPNLGPLIMTAVACRVPADQRIVVVAVTRPCDAIHCPIVKDFTPMGGKPISRVVLVALA